MTAETPSQASSPKSSSFGAGGMLFLVLFGLYLTSGAVVTVVTKSWPVFLPPQVDWISLFVWMFGARMGAYVSGAVLGILGLGLVGLGVLAFAKGRHA